MLVLLCYVLNPCHYKRTPPLPVDTGPGRILVAPVLLSLQKCSFVSQEDSEEAAESEEEEEEEYKNVFETTIVDGKRRHFAPKTNQILDDW